MRPRSFYIYILASKKDGVLYVGVTNDIRKRTLEHQWGIHEGFTKKYCVDKLVYLEEYQSITEAITREKQIKRWRREWKIELIEESNPEWRDLSKEG